MERETETVVRHKLIFEILQKEICAGKYQTELPSEGQLVRRFGVSRFTVVLALKALAAEGLIVRHKGKGSFLTKYAKSSAGPIGLIMPGLAYGEIYAPICSELARICHKNGRTLLLGDFPTDSASALAAAAKQMARDFVAQHVAGVILHPIEYLRDSVGANKEIVSIFEKARVPVVLIDYDIVPPPRRSGYDLVGIDNFSAGRILGEHLAAKGARDVVFVKRHNCAPTVENRLMGVAAALTAVGGTWNGGNVIVAEPSKSGAVVQALKERRRLPDAIVCGYDVHAAKLLKAMEGGFCGLTIPRDIMLAGFDDVSCASIMSPALTTIHQPCREIADVALEMLFRRIASPESPSCNVLLDSQLVVRDSTGCK